LLPLRVFLGATFVYAGVQKLSDPGFLHPGAPTYIGTQLHGFANHTPGGVLLRAFAIPHPQLAGVAVAVLGVAGSAGPDLRRGSRSIWCRASPPRTLLLKRR
jgi:thiosulfate dehydrogenase [quinone] large subunit